MRSKPRLTPEDIVEFFLEAYRQGAFPMADMPAPASSSPHARPASPIIHWYAPDPRAILPLEPGELHVPASLRRHIRSSPFVFTADSCFERVIRACAQPRVPKPGEHESVPWLDETLIRAYCLLHEHGHAHSIEAWLPADDRPGDLPTHAAQLVGGIYGVHLASAFCAESMFCRPALGGSHASNLCLLHLVAHLRASGFTLLDVQIANPHTQRFGVMNIPRDEYNSRLEQALGIDALWSNFDPANILSLL